ncbi:hypothetical protein Tco_0157725 [Tanacetum coccineum]
MICCGLFVTRMAKKIRLLTDEVLDGLSAPIYCRSLDAATLRELIGPNRRLITKDLTPGVPRFAMPRPQRPKLKDLYDRMGRMEIQQGVLERMSRMQSHHSDRYAGFFEFMAGHYRVPLAGAYAPPGYDKDVLKCFLADQNSRSGSLKGEVAEIMAETMEQYMSKTQADYGSGVARPKIEDMDNFELQGQFLKELRTNTFSGLDHEDANEHIEKVLEIVDLFHIPNITIDQVMLRDFLMSLTGATSLWIRNKSSGFDYNLGRSEDKEVVLFYNGLDVPTRQILDSRGAIPSKTAADAKVAI